MGAPILLVYGPESRRNGIDNLLVLGPDRIPFKRYNGLRRPLGQHELCQGLDSHSPAANTLIDIREPLPERV